MLAMRDPRRLLREVPRTATSAGLISAVLGVAVATALIGWLRGHADIPNLRQRPASMTASSTLVHTSATRISTVSSSWGRRASQ